MPDGGEETTETEAPSTDVVIPEPSGSEGTLFDGEQTEEVNPPLPDGTEETEG